MRNSFRYAILLLMAKDSADVNVRESKISDNLSRLLITVKINSKQKQMFCMYKSKVVSSSKPSYYVTNECHHDVATQVYNQLKKGVLA